MLIDQNLLARFHEITPDEDHERLKTALLFEIRPQWNDPANILELPFAKLRFVKSSKIWKLYWMRGSGKWEAYEPLPESTDLHKLLTEIINDAYSCFFG